MKLVTAEQESPALIDWLNVHPDERLATSAVGHIELIRAATRAGSGRHRIITVQGETRDVVIIGERLRDDDNRRSDRNAGLLPRRPPTMKNPRHVQPRLVMHQRAATSPQGA